MWFEWDVIQGVEWELLQQSQRWLIYIHNYVVWVGCNTRCGVGTTRGDLHTQQYKVWSHNWLIYIHNYVVWTQGVESELLQRWLTYTTIQGVESELTYTTMWFEWDVIQGVESGTTTAESELRWLTYTTMWFEWDVIQGVESELRVRGDLHTQLCGLSGVISHAFSLAVMRIVNTNPALSRDAILQALANQALQLIGCKCHALYWELLKQTHLHTNTTTDRRVLAPLQYWWEQNNWE